MGRNVENGNNGPFAVQNKYPLIRPFPLSLNAQNHFVHRFFSLGVSRSLRMCISILQFMGLCKIILVLVPMQGECRLLKHQKFITVLRALKFIIVCACVRTFIICRFFLIDECCFYHIYRFCKWYWAWALVCCCDKWSCGVTHGAFSVFVLNDLLLHQMML